jgi:hypothetical protein
MRRLVAVSLLSSLGGLAYACSSSPPSTLGLTEPLRVRGGAFHEGELPGAAPDSGAAGPSITTVESLNNVVRQFQANKSFTGRTSTDGVSVGLRFGDVGTGYWVLPVDAPDPQANGELTWQAISDIGELTPGLHPLRIVAFNNSGVAGAQTEIPLCVSSPVPDNLHACDPTKAPPAAVLALTWDTDVDLDLRVLTSFGKTIEAKTPSSALPDGGKTNPAATGVGVLDGDSNANCVLDGRRREQVVWQTAPTAGTYQVYANLFDSCGQASVRFHVTLYRRTEASPGNGGDLAVVLERDAALLRDDANGGAAPSTFVTELTFP